MALKKIFNKKKSNKKIYIFIFFLIIFTTTVYFFIFNKKYNYKVIPSDESNFYIVPKDRGGEKVTNIDKKSLNLKAEQEFIKILNQPENIYFSIQFYTNNDLDNIRKYLNKLNNTKESVYNPNDFFIMALNSEIGTDYFLLYKSFKTRGLAKKYCEKFLRKLDKCLIIDTNKF